MKTVKELIHASTALLTNNGIGSSNYSKPKYPTCVVYFGKRSQLYHDELIGDVTRGWGGNTDYVKFYVIEDVESKVLKNVLSGEELSDEDVRAQITGLLSSQDVFSDMRYVSLYCVMDTTDIKDVSEFEKWYMSVQYLEKLIGVPTTSMLMLILNQSLNLAENAKLITKKLGELYASPELGRENTHIYDSVFILSNRLKDGSFKIYDPQMDGNASSTLSYKNFNLLGNVILLSNTRDPDFDSRKHKLYGNDKPAVIASYRYLQKPMKEIVMIALSSILEKLKEMILTYNIDADILGKALNITSGRSKLHEEIYTSIKEYLPNNDFINYLPGKRESVGSFVDVDRSSYGCLQMFIEQNHLKIVKEKLASNKEYEYRTIVSMLSSNLNAAQLVNGIHADVRKTTYSNAEMGLANTDRMNVFQSIDIQVKQMIADELKVLIDKAISQSIDKATMCMDAFRALCVEFENAYAVGEEGTRRNLKSFYVDKINRYYSDINKVKALLVKLLNIDNGKTEMLQVLNDELVRLFESDAVYKYSYAQELMARLGRAGNEREIQEQIAKELIEGLENRTCYYTNSTYHGRVMEAYMLNTSDNEDSLTVKYLNARSDEGGITRTFFNTCSNDAAESMWFYHCTLDNLLM